MCLCALALSGCGLPRSGPSPGELLSGAAQAQRPAHLVALTDAVVRAAAADPAGGFPRSFLDAAETPADAIAPGDTLDLRVWENVSDGLLAGSGQSATRLDQVQVDDAGFIFVPYAGRVRAAGATPEALRGTITALLAAQTPDPQVAVVRTAGDGASVSVLGSVGGQGVYPVDRPTRRLTGLLARAGGVTVAPEVARITLRRGGQSGSVWMTDLQAHPRLDVALRPGDVVIVEEDRRSFIALGATGGQRRVDFDSQSLSALDALALAGGLSTQLADPRGIFVLRDEPAAIANRVLGRGDLAGPQRLVYTIDLTAPNGLFLARDFGIRDGDTVYVTEAPYVRWQKSLQVLTGSAGAVNAVDGLAR